MLNEQDYIYKLPYTIIYNVHKRVEQKRRKQLYTSTGVKKKSNLLRWFGSRMIPYTRKISFVEIEGVCQLLFCSPGTGERPPEVHLISSVQLGYKTVSGKEWNKK